MVIWVSSKQSLRRPFSIYYASVAFKSRRRINYIYIFQKLYMYFKKYISNYYIGISKAIYIFGTNDYTSNHTCIKNYAYISNDAVLNWKFGDRLHHLE